MDSERTHPVYEAPEIVDLGPVEELTQGPGGTLNDGVSEASTAVPL
jgi:hypothetical protein